MIGTVVLGLLLMGPRLYNWATGELVGNLTNIPSGVMGQDAFMGVLKSAGSGALVVVAPFLALFSVGSILSSVAVGGVVFSPAGLRPDISRISPIKGIKNLFSTQALMTLLAANIKLAILVGVAWLFLRSRQDMILSLQFTAAPGMLSTIGQLVVGLVLRVAVAMVVVSLGDVVFQKWQYKRKLRMTQHEVKEEIKQYELPAQVRSRIRSLQFQSGRRRSLKAVPEADVVVTNPTHYAVALKYDAATMRSPTVVAKGADLLCQKIKEIAREHKVPIVERPQLARALFDTVEINEPIPETLFTAVAEILAMIYRMRKRTSTARTTQN